MTDRFLAGNVFPNIKTQTILGREISIPDPAHRWTHIQFLRFADCPVCNLHLRPFVARSQELKEAGIREVLVFHSKPEILLDHKKSFPFDVVGDPRRTLYKRLRVGSSPKALLDPRVLPSLGRGYRLRPSRIPDSSPFGLPADFLVSDNGQILSCKYGTHADDQWSVDDILHLVSASDAGVKSKFDLEACKVQVEDIGASKIAYRKVGSGKPLVLIHGYPLSGMTLRKIIPALAARFTCYVVDLPGAGDTQWTEATDFSFRGQAQSLKTFLRKLSLTSYALLAHDTGGTIGRQLAILDGERVTKLVLIGTEIPGHRPPWIPFFQKISNPKSTSRLQRLMGAQWFRRSSAGFGGCFADLSLIEGDFYRLFIQPLVASHHQASGQIRYLLGIDWALVDSLKTEHAKITAPTLLIWGENDPVFPITLAKQMIPQFRDCRGLVAIPNGKLFVHEEQPGPVAQHCLDFLVND